MHASTPSMESESRSLVILTGAAFVLLSGVGIVCIWFLGRVSGGIVYLLGGVAALAFAIAGALVGYAAQHGQTRAASRRAVQAEQSAEAAERACAQVKVTATEAATHFADALHLIRAAASVVPSSAAPGGRSPASNGAPATVNPAEERLKLLLDWAMRWSTSDGPR